MGINFVPNHMNYLIKLLKSPGYSSGQRGRTVNPLAFAYVGSNPAPGTELANLDFWVIIPLNGTQRYHSRWFFR
ncbi:MAG: hypothetical protein UX87_C0003G0011 [Candidatus Amesbacteria bacterium GW2011_GWA1_47_16]|uniref:Uncharacterized protein n=1 Tax=Candidatus Amesbacteria bacterium GW2011_GWA1_47_16 TaxID=1618353 RepID=A0A0G1V4I5_9BACT|nr:MAG: hypothetical protein UX87_C0003G0011 [Candidatus Amesbacteria bacterium GW2011_GWA1_47_16]